MIIKFNKIKERSMKKILITSLLGAVLFIGCSSEEDLIVTGGGGGGSTSEPFSCEGTGTFDPSGYTFTITDSENWPIADGCGEAGTGTDNTNNVADWFYVFESDTVTTSEGMVGEKTFTWCIDANEVMTMIDDDGEAEISWTFTSDTDATSEVEHIVECRKKTYLGTATVPAR